MLSCSLEFFRKGITIQFTEGITVEIFGLICQIDHTTPRSDVSILDENYFRKCFNWVNLGSMPVYDFFEKYRIWTPIILFTRSWGSLFQETNFVKLN